MRHGVRAITAADRKAAQWTYTILYSFKGGKDGYLPSANLVFDAAGNLYGATYFGGGKGTSCDPYYQYCGTVFKLSPPKTKDGGWTEKVLYSFEGLAAGAQFGDGANPNGGLVLDSKGAIYGTTYIGGYNCPHNSGQGCGTVFELRPRTVKGGAWTENILHRFEISENEANPAAGLTFDGKGYLYGTTAGTVFRLAPPITKSGRWKETILYTFNQDAYDPKGALIFDVSGNLYGTAEYGNNGSRYGSVFRLRPPNTSEGPWGFGVLYGFTGSPDGAYPAANLTFDQHGSLSAPRRAVALEQVVRNTAVQYSRFGRSKRTPQWELIGLRNFGVKEKGHEKHTEIYLRLDILCMTAVIGSCLSVFPTRANAQGSPGQNAVYNSSSGIVGSYAFIDASTFAAGAGPGFRQR